MGVGSAGAGPEFDRLGTSMERTHCQGKNTVTSDTERHSGRSAVRGGDPLGGDSRALPWPCPLLWSPQPLTAPGDPPGSLDSLTLTDPVTSPSLPSALSRGRPTVNPCLPES